MAVVQNLKVFAACTGGSDLLRLLIESRQKFSGSGTKGEFRFADLSALHQWQTYSIKILKYTTKMTKKMKMKRKGKKKKINEYL